MAGTPEEVYETAVRAAEATYTAAYESARATRDAAVQAADEALEAEVAADRAVRDAALELALAEYDEARGVVREVVDGDSGTGVEA